ncbi:MAG: immunity protein Tsi6 family protein [Acidimicrobiales bacterium]
MGEPSSRAEAAALAERALAMTEERLGRLPAGALHDMHSSIRLQLEFMHRTAAAGGVPTVAEKNSLSLGVIAVREFESTDVTYCDAICDAVYAFEKLA